MSEKFRCDKCGRNFENVYNLKRHMNKKTPCVHIGNELKKYKFQCEICRQRFTRQDYLTQHKEQNGCKHFDIQYIKNIIDKNINNTVNSNNIINNNLDKCENCFNTNTTNNITNNNITNNYGDIIVNINVVPYGKEDLSFMTEKEIRHFLFMGVMSIPELVEFIHFNKNKPEFHNICITNIKSKYAKKYDGNKWKLCCKEDAIEEEYNRTCDFLENMYNEYKKRGVLGDLTITKMEKFLVRKDEKDYMQKMAAKILLIMYNNKDIVEQTMNKQ